MLTTENQLIVDVANQFFSVQEFQFMNDNHLDNKTE
jgi:hypothetical protein